MVVAFGAWLAGAAPRAVAECAVLALAPGLVGFVLLPRLGDARWVALLVVVWMIVAVGLVTVSGGAASPLAAVFVIAPAQALALGRRWAPEIGLLGIVGYLSAVILALSAPPQHEALGVFPQLLAAASLAFAAGLMALAPGPSTREAAMARRVAEVSHELRTPLTHILGFSEMIERRMFGELSDRYAEYAGLIRQSGAHLLGLVNDLLDLSKIEAGRFELVLEEFDVRDVVDDVVRFATDAAEKKQIALGIVTTPTPLNVRADARSLKRMLINTLGNALKFTPEGGRVMVVARAVNDTLVLETADNGPGIPEAERASLGQAYERGSGGARAEGTGLGLALVRALAELHGGDLSFHDAPGGGALVRITLPVLAA